MKRAAFAAIAACSLAAALFAAIHHPLLPFGLSLAVVAWAAVSWRWPSLWLIAVPAFLPLLNFSPWTGWVAIEEFDLFVLAAAAGGYVRLVASRNMEEVLTPMPMLFRGLLVLLLVATVVALERGISDAGGLTWDFFGGYRHSMNSVRVGKGMFLAVLLLPLLRRAFLADAVQAVGHLVGGIVTGLAFVALVATWERLVYPGFFDFSYVYRVTALFWEMHVGGGAIDGYLALAVPFAAWGMFEGKSFWRWLASAVLVVVVGYAVLMTFSRGVYAAVPSSLAALAWLRARQHAAKETPDGLSVRARLVVGLSLVAGLQLGFQLAGYRGAGAIIMLVIGAMVVNALRRLPWWPSSLHTQGGIAVALLLITEAVAVANGGSLLLERLRSSEHDFGGRLEHWRRGIDLLDSSGDWLLGKGLGRMPSQYAARNGVDEIPADFRLASVAGRDGVVLFGPPTRVDLAGLYGMAQRISLQADVEYSLSLEAWNVAETTLQVSLCEKHLLYPADCLVGVTMLRPIGRWQHVTVPLSGMFAKMPWYARRQGVLAVAVLEPGRTVAVNQLSLIAQGSQRLENGDFAAGLSRWFLDGSFYFQPWHIDNLWLEALLDGGLFLATMLWLLWAMTLWRLILGDAREHTLAPILASALLAHFVIALFASQMDAPRVSFLMFLVMFTVWMLPVARSADSSFRHQCPAATMG